MKISVLVGPNGEVLATVRHPMSQAGRQHVPNVGLAAGPGQTLHEIELPSELEKIESAEELHHALKSHLPKPTSRGGKKK